MVHRNHGEDSSVLVSFQPPLFGYYTTVHLRVCPKSNRSGRRTASRESVVAGAENVTTTRRSVVTDPWIPRMDVPNSTSPRSVEANWTELLCQEHQVMEPRSGRAEVRLPGPLEEFNFRLIVYMDGETVQITEPVHWNSPFPLKNINNYSLTLAYILVHGRVPANGANHLFDKTSMANYCDFGGRGDSFRSASPWRCEGVAYSSRIKAFFEGRRMERFLNFGERHASESVDFCT
ncbi:unnamed protein product [Protopolystoma xenopodis]|uniref:Uncharacterized protein n=1 Tax=Protopolystoma xenopodis TaxID=117903 RepID=A0A448XCT8_9PLAT|nr:unnamed protein product [Protopolystoma xenopodis]